MVVTSSLVVGGLSLLAGGYLYLNARAEATRWVEKHGVGDVGTDPATLERSARRNRWFGAGMVLLGAGLLAYGLLG